MTFTLTPLEDLIAYRTQVHERLETYRRRVHEDEILLARLDEQVGVRRWYETQATTAAE